MKKVKLTILTATLALSFGAIAFLGFGDSDDKDKINPEKIAKIQQASPTAVVDENMLPEKTTEECEAPAWAKAIGHEQKWKLHNGCPSTETE